ncbi:MAG: peptide deformylase [Patescibacteria group bacterium]|nr:peptide deformylase [Patescibacteria group bacterium]
MKILTIVDKNKEKFLRTKAADFDFAQYNKKEIAELIKKMKEIMLETRGIGLSANQVGLNLNFFITQVPQFENDKIIGQKSYAIFNPEIIKFSKQTEIVEEGCLSVPGIHGEVERPLKITVTGFDKNGRKIKIKAEGLTARVFQHETDHLNGILFIDKIKK